MFFPEPSSGVPVPFLSSLTSWHTDVQPQWIQPVPMAFFPVPDVVLLGDPWAPNAAILTTPSLQPSSPGPTLFRNDLRKLSLEFSVCFRSDTQAWKTCSHCIHWSCNCCPFVFLLLGNLTIMGSSRTKAHLDPIFQSSGCSWTSGKGLELSISDSFWIRPLASSPKLAAFWLDNNQVRCRLPLLLDWTHFQRLQLGLCPRCLPHPCRRGNSLTCLF